MCRIFGFRSVILSQVHKSLLSADNALGLQSLKNPDGWGVSYYIGQTPHLIRSTKSALEDSLFQKISGIVSSQTVVAHIRKATQGHLNILNCHPFQFANWTFAHNGNIKDFDKHKEKIKRRISPELKRFILGDTDSEIFFLFLLTKISQYMNLTTVNPHHVQVKDALDEAIQEMHQIIGTLSTHQNALPSENFLTFILTNGKLMYGFQGGQSLYYSTYKNQCSDRDSCPSFTDACENQTKDGIINHLIFSSEPLSGENIWLEMKPGEMISIDENFMLHQRALQGLF
jgi:predicted glutamine amidotransferase